jgi:LacI family transcriptional regulator
MTKVTLKVIANQLGLSTSTVSKALKDYSDINSETKRKVQELAKSLNYTPNSFAVSLRMKESKTIGVIIPTMVHFFFSNVIDGILKEAENNDYMIFIMQSNENEKLEKKQVDLLLSKGVDGIIISLTNKTRDFNHLQKIIDNNVPLILFDKITKTINCSKVLIDDRKAAYDAVSHLIKKGHKRIAHFRGDLNPQNSIDRFLGYKKALLDHNLEFDPSLVYLCNNNSDFSDGYKSAEKLLQDHGENVDAIFTVNDLLAIGALNYFNENNIKVPERIALFGFSNWFMTEITTPSLSTIDQNANLMGEKSAKLLIQEINCMHKGIPFEHQKIIIDTALIIRNSC